MRVQKARSIVKLNETICNVQAQHHVVPDIVVITEFSWWWRLCIAAKGVSDAWLRFGGGWRRTVFGGTVNLGVRRRWNKRRRWIEWRQLVVEVGKCEEGDGHAKGGGGFVCLRRRMLRRRTRLPRRLGVLSLTAAWNRSGSVACLWSREMKGRGCVLEG